MWKAAFFSATDILSVGRAKNTNGTEYVCKCADEKAGSKGNPALYNL
jgi:hypothetical protein